MLAYLRTFIKKAADDDLFAMADGLTYHVLLAFFPFIIFLMALLGFLDLDVAAMLDGLYKTLPSDVYGVASRFIAEIYPNRSHGLLSVSLLFTLYAIANGFNEVIRCVNRAYGCDEKSRGWLKKISVSIALMLIFTLALIIMLFLLIFNRYLWGFLRPLFSGGGETLYTAAGTLVSLAVLLMMVTLIYKLACVRALKFLEVLPGAAFTVLLWAASSKGFSFFIAHFTNYTRIYGSIASVFILILWLDTVSLILLCGNHINALRART